MNNNKNIDPSSIKDIVWIQTAFIGDLVLNSAAIELVHKKFPNIRQHLITSRRASDLFYKDSRLSSCLILDKKSLFPIKNFRYIKDTLNLSKEHSLILQPHKSIRSTMLSLYLKIPFVTFKDTSLSFLSYKRYLYDRSIHECFRNSQLLKVLGLNDEEIFSVTPKLEGIDSSNKVVEKIMNDCSKKRIIVIAPSSEWETKCWPKEKYVTLINMLNKKYDDCIFLIIGATKDRDLNEYIKNSVIEKDKVINLASLTSLIDLRYIFSRINMIISGDSGPMHIASSFDKGVVVIFGPTSSSMGYTPLCNNQKIVELDLDCRPCSKHGNRTCPKKHFKCMLDLEATQVFDACCHVLENSSK